MISPCWWCWHICPLGSCFFRRLIDMILHCNDDQKLLEGILSNLNLRFFITWLIIADEAGIELDEWKFLVSFLRDTSSRASHPLNCTELLDDLNRSADTPYFSAFAANPKQIAISSLPWNRDVQTRRLTRLAPLKAGPSRPSKNHRPLSFR